MGFRAREANAPDPSLSLLRRQLIHTSSISHVLVSVRNRSLSIFYRVRLPMYHDCLCVSGGWFKRGFASCSLLHSLIANTILDGWSLVCTSFLLPEPTTGGIFLHLGVLETCKRRTNSTTLMLFGPVADKRYSRVPSQEKTCVRMVSFGSTCAPGVFFPWVPPPQDPSDSQWFPSYGFIHGCWWQLKAMWWLLYGWYWYHISTNPVMFFDRY